MHVAPGRAAGRAGWPSVACIEVGGGGVETVVLGGPEPVVLQGAAPHDGLPVLMAVPGLIEGDRVLAASNLDWWNVDPAAQLGVDRSATLLLNDAEAAALGESALRDGADLVYVGPRDRRRRSRGARRGRGRRQPVRPRRCVQRHCVPLRPDPPSPAEPSPKGP